jgi:gas vesicle protein
MTQPPSGPKKKSTYGLDIKKAKKKLDRLFLGAVIGGAVGSILGIGLHSKKGRDMRRTINEKRRETWRKISQNLEEADSDNGKNKNSFWNRLHRIFFTHDQ